ncbi:flavodoxin family protein [Clostridium oryzae]|uniref:2-amino-4-deoxychorismate dehydrogenase n=1 Tax=Clostridium oryzae TaxID=1450648 RepID=A0A1V4IVG3_9CLOT|nr:flavodoxin family protein [Clostridium oryzae]OPJ64022.1 2-amino-4-deoxychorismate dehydrogenase [Clostridium oryzae]
MDKKWLAMVGSSRSGKNTDLLVDYVIDGLKYKGIAIDKYILNSSNISTCNGCEYCINTGKCRINDEAAKIISSMKEADGYIFASPTHNYNMTAQMKALLDRTFCLNDYSNGWKSRIAAGKKAILIGVCGGGTKESIGYTIEGMNKVISELGVEIIEEIEYYNSKNNPVYKNAIIKEEIVQRIRENKKI